jgi:tyrosine-protein phosphatase SIW14
VTLRILSAALALSLASCAPSSPSGAAPSSQIIEAAHIHVPKSVPATPQEPIDLPGLPNFGFISPDVWRGGEPTRDGLKTLAAMGVKTVIDLRESDESANVPLGVYYVRLPISAWHADSVDVPEVLRTIAASPKPVFIHCREGRDRTGLAIAAFRLSQGMNADDACRELHNFHVNLWWSGPIENRVRALAHSSVPR